MTTLSIYRVVDSNTNTATKCIAAKKVSNKNCKADSVGALRSENGLKAGLDDNFYQQVIYILTVYQTHVLHLWKGIRHPPKIFLDMTLSNLMLRLQ